MLLANKLRCRAHAAGHDNLAVFLQRGANRAKRFIARGIQEPACVDDNEIGPVVLSRDLVSFRTQPREDAFGIDKCLRTAETDKTDAWSCHSINPVGREGGAVSQFAGFVSSNNKVNAGRGANALLWPRISTTLLWSVDPLERCEIRVGPMRCGRLVAPWVVTALVVLLPLSRPGFGALDLQIGVEFRARDLPFFMGSLQFGLH